MKRLNLMAIGLLMFAACSGPASESEDKVTDETLKVGTDEDGHGCKGSPGYTWSEIKNDCIQVFNEGFRLNPVVLEKGKEEVSAFVLMNNDQSKVELFLPDSTTRSILLDKSGKLLFSNETYEYDADKSLLYADGKLVYKGNVE
ncbi:hypothetical protein [Pedobacter sp. GR22-6]|uniref:hypothetical protein n=1 Tax=Pedobacter sp. GR22-6 TaxID=3127957 RepID=UPI00307F200A